MCEFFFTHDKWRIIIWRVIHKYMLAVLLMKLWTIFLSGKILVQASVENPYIIIFCMNKHHFFSAHEYALFIILPTLRTYWFRLWPQSITLARPHVSIINYSTSTVICCNSASYWTDFMCYIESLIRKNNAWTPRHYKRK